MRLTRRYHFAASHRLESPALTAEENRRLYGKCNYPHGHGHDYTLELSVEGSPDEAGQVVNRADLDEFVHDRVVRLLDHKNLNLDVPEFRAVPTTENLAAFIAQRLTPEWPLKARLAGIRIIETARNTFELELNGQEVG